VIRRFHFNYMQKIISIIRFLAIATITVTSITGFLLGCSKNKSVVGQYAAAPGKGDEITRLNEQLFATAKMNVDPSDYLLGAGDLLQITVFEAENLNTTVRVSSRGYVTLSLLGQIEIKGLTIRTSASLLKSM
jgi:hypothetical protein